MKYIMKFMNTTRRGTVILLAMLLTMSLMTWVVSAHGGDTTLIHACVIVSKPDDDKNDDKVEAENNDRVKSRLGSIRIVGENETCRRNEMPLDWNIQGEPGPAGPPGPSGVSGYQIVTHQEFLAPGTFANVHVECPVGKKVLGGGFSIETPDDVKVFSSEPSDGLGNVIDHGWNVLVHNMGTVSRQTTVSAICASVQ